MRLRPSTPSLIVAAGLCALMAGGLAGCSKKAADPVEATAAPTNAVAPTGATEGQSGAQTAQTDSSMPPSGAPDRGPGMGAPMTKASMEARSDERFDRMDSDHDGVLSSAELAAAADDRGGGPSRGGPGGGGRGFGRADADGDGRITKAEARAAADERFARMDANGDGVIGDDERPQWGGRGGN